MSAGTYSQIYIHVIFAVKGRKSLIHENWEIDLYKYITGIIKEKGQILISINGMPDHIHILIAIKPACRVADLVREIKKSSNKWINEHKFTVHKFSWQEGYGVFSHSHSAIPRVKSYIDNQKSHHAKKNFKNEYRDLLDRFDIDYREEYLFEWVQP